MGKAVRHRNQVPVGHTQKRKKSSESREDVIKEIGRSPKALGVLWNDLGAQ